jgi:hypothetical protein
MERDSNVTTVTCFMILVAWNMSSIYFDGKNNVFYIIMNTGEFFHANFVKIFYFGIILHSHTNCKDTTKSSCVPTST